MRSVMEALKKLLEGLPALVNVKALARPALIVAESPVVPRSPVR